MRTIRQPHAQCPMSCFPPGRIPNFPKCTHSLFFGVAMTLTLSLFVKETEKYHLILFTLTSICIHIPPDLRLTYTYCQCHCRSYTLINVNPFSCLCVRHKTAGVPKEAVCPAPVARARKPRSHSYKYVNPYTCLCVPASHFR